MSHIGDHLNTSFYFHLCKALVFNAFFCVFFSTFPAAAFALTIYSYQACNVGHWQEPIFPPGGVFSCHCVSKVRCSRSAAEEH